MNESFSSSLFATLFSHGMIYQSRIYCVTDKNRFCYSFWRLFFLNFIELSGTVWRENSGIQLNRIKSPSENSGLLFFHPNKNTIIFCVTGFFTFFGIRLSFPFTKKQTKYSGNIVGDQSNYDNFVVVFYFKSNAFSFYFFFWFDFRFDICFVFLLLLLSI